MVNRIVAKNRNVIVVINTNVLSKFAIMLKHKDELNVTELLELEDFMKALKKIPQDVAKYIYLRFIKLSVIEQRDGYVIKNRIVNRIDRKYKCKVPSLTDVSKVMSKSYSELKRLEDVGYQELADLLLNYQLDRMELWEYVVYDESVYDTSYDKAKERFDKLIGDDMPFDRYEIEQRKVYEDLEIYQYKIKLFKAEWRLKDDDRRGIYKEGTHDIQRQCSGFRGRNRLFQS